MKLSYSILTTSFIQKLFVVPTEKNIIYITIYYCVTKKINIEKKMIMNLIITKSYLVIWILKKPTI